MRLPFVAAWLRQGGGADPPPPSGPQSHPDSIFRIHAEGRAIHFINRADGLEKEDVPHPFERFGKKDGRLSQLRLRREMKKRPSIPVRVSVEGSGTDAAGKNMTGWREESFVGLPK